MADEVSNFGLDASGAFNELDKLNTYFEKAAIGAGKLASAFTTSAKEGDTFSVSMKSVASTGDKMNLTFRQTDEGLIQVAKSYSLVNREEQKAAELKKQITDWTRLYNQTIKDLAQEEEKQSKIAAIAAAEAERAAERKFILNQKLMGQLAQSKNQGQNQFAAQQVGDSLFAQRKSDDPAYLTRLSAAINGVVAQISNGNVEASRAQQIIGNVLSGQSALYSGHEAKISAAATRMVAANDQIARSGENTNQRLTLSWASIARLGTIQIIHTALRTFIQEVEQSITATAEFEKKISEIRTISQDTGVSFDSWARSIRAVSDEFGNPILDVTEGVYQVISNQVAKGSEAIEHMSEVLKFARVTQASAADATNLLDSAINSFQLTAGDTNEIAGQFFKTIDLGRLRASDIANTFGRVGPEASQLGVKLTEVDAALAQLTINGVPANDAITLLNNVMTTLTKGSGKEIKEFFQQLGVTTGQQAIEMYGFAEVLKRLDQFSHGASEEIAAMFRNIRGFRGEIGLTGQFLDGYNSKLRAITNSQAEYNKAQQIAQESPGYKLGVEKTQVTNFFGEQADAAIKNILAVGHALSDDGLRGVIKGLESTLYQGIAAWTSYQLITRGAQRIAEARVQTVVYENRVTVEQTAALEAQNQALIYNTETENLNAAAKAHRAEAMELESILTREEVTLTAEATAAMRLDAAANIADAEAIEVQATARGTATVAARGFGASLTSLLTPTTLVAAGLFTVFEIWNAYDDLSKEIAVSFQKAADAEAASMAKMSADIEKNLSKQAESFNKHLNGVFVGYTAFGTAIQNKLDEIFESQMEDLRLVSDETHKTIQEYIKDYDDLTRKETQDAEQAKNNILKIEESIDRAKEDFAERDFKRKMQAAEHGDRMQSGIKGGFDEGQIGLIQDEIARLEKERRDASEIAPSVTDPKERAANLALVEKGINHENQLTEDLLTRRNKLEEDHKRTLEEVEKLSERIKEKSERIEASDSARDDRTNASSLGKRTPANFLRNSARDTSDEDAKKREQEELDNYKKQLGELQLKLDAETKSLALIPEAKTLNESLNSILEEGNRIRREAIELEELAQATAAANEKKREEKFKRLRADMQEMLKLSSENLPDDSKKIQDRVTRFSTLMTQATAEGLDPNSSTYGQLLAQREKLQETSNAKIEALNQKSRIAELNQQKAALEDAAKAQRAAEAAASAKVLSTFTTPRGVLGGKEKGEIETAFTKSFWGVKLPVKGLGVVQDATNEQAALKSKLNELEDAAKVFTNTGAQIPANIVKNYEDALTKYEARLKELAANNFKLSEIPVKSDNTDEQGRPTADTTLQTEMDRLKRLPADLAQAAAERNRAVGQKGEIDAGVKKLDAELTKIGVSLGVVNTKADPVATSFGAITEKAQGLVESMVTLRKAIDQLGPPAPVNTSSGKPFGPGLSTGGLIPEYYSIGGGPKGTDIVPAWLTPGERVMTVAAVQKYGPVLEQMEQDKGGRGNYYAAGGSVKLNQQETDLLLEFDKHGFRFQTNTELREIIESLNNYQKTGHHAVYADEAAAILEAHAYNARGRSEAHKLRLEANAYHQKNDAAHQSQVRANHESELSDFDKSQAIQLATMSDAAREYYHLASQVTDFATPKMDTDQRLGSSQGNGFHSYDFVMPSDIALKFTKADLNSDYSFSGSGGDFGPNSSGGDFTSDTWEKRFASRGGNFVSNFKERELPHFSHLAGAGAYNLAPGIANYLNEDRKQRLHDQYYAMGGIADGFNPNVSNAGGNQSVGAINNGNTANFGDINVNLNSTGNVHHDARTLASLIQQEVRRTGINLGRNKHD